MSIIWPACVAVSYLNLEHCLISRYSSPGAQAFLWVTAFAKHKDISWFWRILYQGCCNCLKCIFMLQHSKADFHLIKSSLNHCGNHTNFLQLSMFASISATVINPVVLTLSICAVKPCFLTIMAWQQAVCAFFVVRKSILRMFRDTVFSVNISQATGLGHITGNHIPKKTNPLVSTAFEKKRGTAGFVYKLVCVLLWMDCFCIFVFLSQRV